ncbi:MAG: HD domain-containing protein [Thermofilaceae archaeon]
MSALKLEFREPYPVYRGLRVPVWERDQPVSVRRVTDGDRREFEELLSLLRTLLERLVGAWRRAGVSERELLWKTADAIVLLLRSPLIMEASPVAPTPLKANALYLLLPEGLMERRAVKEAVENPYIFAEYVANLRSADFRQIEELFEERTSELVLGLWLKFPADTRPGFNTSSLVAHSLLTSALAWALEHLRGADELQQARVRLAALLHDLGKAVDPERHYEASEDLARKLLGGLLPNDEVEAIARLVREHHIAASSLNQADRLAAAADRLAELVDKLLGEKLARMEKLLGVSRDDWEFWRRAYRSIELLRREGVALEDPVRELTQEFLEKVAALGREELVGREGAAPAGLSLVLIDIGSVQEFIYRSQEIRIVSAASYLIDLIVHAHLPMYLRTKGVRLPPEAVIYSGGGTLLMLLPESLAERVEQLVGGYERLVGGVRIYCVRQPFTSSYALAADLLAQAMSLKKHSVELGGLSAQPVERLCRLCYSAPAVQKAETPEGPVDTCETCARLYELGSEFHFRAKWESQIQVAGRRFSPSEAFDRGWGDASRRIMEIIAGHDFEELEKGVQKRNYAVVKFDGNMMGSFMLEAISFTDAVERSFRIDVAIKRAYLRALEALYQGVREVAGSDEAEKAVSQVYLGTIYMGGDDGLILAPSWAAPILAHYIAEEFCRQLGLARGLSVAVAAGPVAMSVWSLIDCAGELLRAAKDCVKKMGGASGQVGALVFDIYESGSPSGSSAVERLSYMSDRLSEATAGLSAAEIARRRLERRADSMQPYLIDVRPGKQPEAWETLFSTVFELAGWSNPRSFELHKLALGKAYLASRPERDTLGQDERERLKALRNAVLQAWGEMFDSPYWREKLYIYARRQQSREAREEHAWAYAALVNLMNKTLISQLDRGVVPLADVINMIKLAGGGAR